MKVEIVWKRMHKDLWALEVKGRDIILVQVHRQTSPLWYCPYNYNIVRTENLVKIKRAVEKWLKVSK